LIATRSIAEQITPQRETFTASLTVNVASSCRAFYATQLLRLPGTHTSILCSLNRQHGDLGDVQDGADFASLAQGVYPKLRTPGKHPG
jgi:hypothetical protein